MAARSPLMPGVVLLLAVPTALSSLAGCRDLSGFSSGGDHYDGYVVKGDYVRAGIAEDTRACLTIDADHLEDLPGRLSTSDGRFHTAALRPIPQIWHDSLSTLSFGEGRVKNLIYVVAATAPFGDGNGDDVLAVVSLMQSGDVELRLIRGAPGLSATDGAAPVDGGADAGSGGPVFGIFGLGRQRGPCSF
jgi:hypothetical protein